MQACQFAAEVQSATRDAALFQDGAILASGQGYEDEVTEWGDTLVEVQINGHLVYLKVNDVFASSAVKGAHRVIVACAPVEVGDHGIG